MQFSDSDNLEPTPTAPHGLDGEATPTPPPTPGAGTRAETGADVPATASCDGEGAVSDGSGPLADAERREQVRAKIVEAIRTVHDPEIPVNIYELGLIYDIDIKPSGDVNIRMTLTSPACPAAQELPVQVKSVTSRIAEVREAQVDVVFDPPWKPSLMTEDARLLLGIF